MKKVLTLTVAMVALCATMASAAGVNLSLTDCGLNGQAAVSFACNSNSGAPITLIGSVVAPAGIDRMVGMEAVIDAQLASATVPAWWELQSGGCRSTAISYDFNFSVLGPFSCTDFWAGAASGGGGVNLGVGGPNRLRILVVCATAGENPIDESENYMFKVNLIKQKTTGTGSCAGCSTAACLVLNEIKLVQPAGVGDFRIQNPADRNYVTYNTGAPVCPGATATQSKTWGAVKSLYR